LRVGVILRRRSSFSFFLTPLPDPFVLTVRTNFSFFRTHRYTHCDQAPQRLFCLLWLSHSFFLPPPSYFCVPLPPRRSRPGFARESPLQFFKHIAIVHVPGMFTWTSFSSLARRRTSPFLALLIIAIYEATLPPHPTPPNPPTPPPGQLLPLCRRFHNERLFPPVHFFYVLAP